MERLGLALAGGARPRRIYIFESPLRKCHTDKKCCLVAALFIGGLEEIRTPDPHNANVVRSQLRYRPIHLQVLYDQILALSNV